ncbi:glycosyltransferase family 4 protein [Bacillus taeanensis]|uniref:Glycosyltransferase family 1 protein n=1 Tax=Bacillus taeanensis TaxID=273032 RepID=A0A366XWN0_9BACI|nr:glycosyltransferase family 4 protein [Bacillus taeanensis]RBW69958.1 glycosyltransferase family 1 protein [Bacillus taeanensis]
MKILVIWRLLTVGGVNAGWRNRAIHLKNHGIATDFLYTKDLGGMHMMQDIANVYLTKAKLEIIDIIQQNNYDAVVVVDTGKAYKWLAKARYKGPVIVESRTPELIKLKPHIEDFDKVKPNLIIVPSTYQKRITSILINEDLPIQVINNGIDTEFFRPLAEDQLNLDSEPVFPENKKIIGWIGRVDKRKNWRLLLEIAKLIKKERNDIEFWLIGGAKSVEREQFKEAWKKEGLTDIIKWFPVIPYQQMPHVYGKIRKSGGCTLATTKEESFGNTFIEAMACAVPVVAPQISAIPEIVKHGKTGRLYREEHVRGAARQIYRIIDNETHYENLSKAARETVMKHFSLSTCAENYVHLLKKLVGGEKQ